MVFIITFATIVLIGGIAIAIAVAAQMRHS
jgi:hypothetical protein